LHSRELVNHEVDSMLVQGQQALQEVRRIATQLVLLCDNRLQDVETLLNDLQDQVGMATQALAMISSHWGSVQDRYLVGERIIKAQEDERQRVAREIHDGPAQSMANAVLRVEICERLLAAGRPEVTHELSQLKMLAKESLREIRKIIFNLRPMALDDLGLIPTLHRFFENLSELDGTKVELEVVGKEYRLSSTMEVTLFRMIQEAVNNARKHAQAGIIKVTIGYASDKITASVYDDGIGFDIEAVQRVWHERQSFGLMSMRERIQLLNGEFEVRSDTNGGGTTVFAVLPVVASTTDQ
jgi:two-component system sensor histidine kinase DegS